MSRLRRRVDRLERALNRSNEAFDDLCDSLGFIPKNLAAQRSHWDVVGWNTTPTHPFAKLADIVSLQELVKDAWEVQEFKDASRPPNMMFRVTNLRTGGVGLGATEEEARVNAR
jgi:hypothetical protein